MGKFLSNSKLVMWALYAIGLQLFVWLFALPIENGVLSLKHVATLLLSAGFLAAVIHSDKKFVVEWNASMKNVWRYFPNLVAAAITVLAFQGISHYFTGRGIPVSLVQMLILLSLAASCLLFSSWMEQREQKEKQPSSG